MPRIKDVDFECGQLTVRDPKWKHDRMTMLPSVLTAAMHEQIVHAPLVHQEDLACGWGETLLPEAIGRKIPSAARDWRWQWVFPATRRWKNQEGKRGPAPCARNGRSASCDRCSEGIRDRQASDLSHLPPFLCHSPARAWSRHSYRTGAPRPPGRVYDRDLYPRPAPRSTWCSQPARPSVSHITPIQDGKPLRLDCRMGVLAAIEIKLAGRKLRAEQLLFHSRCSRRRDRDHLCFSVVLHQSTSVQSPQHISPVHSGA